MRGQEVVNHVAGYNYGLPEITERYNIHLKAARKKLPEWVSDERPSV